MRTYLVTMCNADGSTPVGGCPEYPIEVEDNEDRYAAAAKAYEAHPGMEIVYIGWIQYIKASDTEKSRE